MHLNKTISFPSTLFLSRRSLWLRLRYNFKDRFVISTLLISATDRSSVHSQNGEMVCRHQHDSVRTGAGGTAQAGSSTNNKTRSFSGRRKLRRTSKTHWELGIILLTLGEFHTVNTSLFAKLGIQKGLPGGVSHCQHKRSKVGNSRRSENTYKSTRNIPPSLRTNPASTRP